jgi:hypothetical protein
MLTLFYTLIYFYPLCDLCAARKSCIVDGPTISWEELFAEPSRGYVICWECDADYRYSTSATFDMKMVEIFFQRVYGCP